MRLRKGERMKVLVTIDALGCSQEEEIEIDNPDMVDWEVKQYVESQVSYEYDVVEEDVDEDS